MNKKRVAIVYSDYYPEVTLSMKEFFLNESKSRDWDIEEFKVFGTYEIPLMVKRVLIKGFDAVAVFGCVVQGKTFHHELINMSVIPALLNLSLEYNTPIGTSILTVKTYKQALLRSRGLDNRGLEAYNSIISFLDS
jgi:6,7-dimethyl-8-ribityllumazine synthase